MIIEKGQVIEICIEQYGDIIPYVIVEFKDTGRDSLGTEAIRNSKYIKVRKISDQDQLKETTDKEGNVVWRI